MLPVQKEWSTFHFCSPRETSVNALNVTLKAQNPKDASQWLKGQEQTGDESRVGNVLLCGTCTATALSPPLAAAPTPATCHSGKKKDG